MADTYTFLHSGSSSQVFKHAPDQGGAFADELYNLRGIWNGSDQKYYTPADSSLNNVSHGNRNPPSNVLFHVLHYNLLGQYAVGCDVVNRNSYAGDTVAGSNLRVFFFDPKFYPTLDRQYTTRLQDSTHGFSGTWKMLCDRVDGGGDTLRSNGLWIRIS